MMGYGYENAAGDRISALIDMINGGGPGRSGDTFEGGGILSLLANAVAKPYGSVRERPGHTPVGAAAATPMEVLRPVATGAGVEPVGTTALPAGRDPWLETPAVEERPSLPGLAGEGYRGAMSRPAATGGRRFMEEDLAVLGNLHPDLAALFIGMRPGDPLSPQQAMFLDAARVGFDAPSATPAVPLPLQGPPVPAPDAALTLPPLQGPPVPPLVPAPTDIPTAPATAYESLGEPTLFTQDQLDAMSPEMRRMAEEHNRENVFVIRPFRAPAAPLVSPRPEPRPEPRNAEAGGLTPPPAPPTGQPVLVESADGVSYLAYPGDRLDLLDVMDLDVMTNELVNSGQVTREQIDQYIDSVGLARALVDLRSAQGGLPYALRPADPVVSPRPKPRPAAVPAAGPAGTDEPIRVPYLGTVFNVFPKTGRVVVEYPVANAEKGYFAAAGDELRPGTQYYYDVMELVNRGR